MALGLTRVQQPAKPQPIAPEQTPAQYAQLHGVTRGGLAPHGVPQRPMTKRERFEFRRALKAKKAEIEAKELSDLVTKLKVTIAQ